MHKLIALSLSSVALLIPSISSALTVHGEVHPERYTFFLTKEGSEQLKQANDLLAKNPQAYTLNVNQTGIQPFDAVRWDGKPVKAVTCVLVDEQLHQSKAEVFERGVINVFKGLSWDFKSNSPCKFGPKIIVNGLVKYDRWGYSLNWGWQRDRLADLERMLMLLDGKPVPDNRADVTRRLGDHIHENRGSNSYEDGMFKIKYFQKGTTHITFRRPELVDKLNDIIARHYPGMLAAQ